MQVNIHEAKAKLSALVELAEKGEQVILARRKKPVARIVAEHHRPATRIGGLAGREFHMGAAFDDPEKNQAIASDFDLVSK